ncbi:MAG TPA: serine hydrolase [Flavitalea sp.]|nr:serine hydrolase [Flavitalea sp.]
MQRRIEKLLQGFHGTAGVFIKELRKNFTVSINSDTIFPTASMVKIPILIGVMNKINYGELSYHQELQYRDSLLYAGVDILGSFKQDEKIELSKVMMLMLTMSDNTASLWLQSLAGTGATINRLLDSIGFEHTRVNSRTPGRDSFRMQYGWGQTTPRELAQLMEKIYRGEIINRDASNKMLRLLGRNYWDEAALSQIPPGIFVASKNGAVNDSRSEILFVSAPSCPYILCIATKNNADESWTENNEAWVLARNISAAVWKHYGKRSDTRK